jgi:hypothetical protein
MTKEEIIRMAREAGSYPAAPVDRALLLFSESHLERFAAFVAAAEREEIMDEWWGCVQSDLENGVKSLNERAAEKWQREYPAMAGFAAAITARGHG